jgi:hypothetical protein
MKGARSENLGSRSETATSRPLIGGADWWGEKLGAPRTSLVLSDVRAGFEPFRAHVIPYLASDIRGKVVTIGLGTFSMMARPRHGSKPARNILNG